MRRVTGTVAILVAIGICGAAAREWDPWAEVRVITDTYGVPHVMADTEDALWFAAGYVYTDRVGRFEPYLVHLARGRMAEVLGRSVLDSDVQTRLARVSEFATEHYGELSASDRRAMERYCEGVEAYRAEFSDRFPAATEACTPQDLVAARKLWVFKTAVDMARGRGEFPQNSNMWAVAPERTHDGFSIYSGNPHVPFEDRVIEMHLVGPDTDVYGISRGLFVFSGANRRVAWSETTNFTDAADVYQIEIDAGDPDRYRYDDAWREFEKRDEVFRVRQPDGTLRELTRTLRWSHHGPIVDFDEKAGVAWAVRVTQADQIHLYTQYREQMRASTVAEFQHSLRHQARSTVNLGCADVEGNIGYVWLGRAAKRPPGFDFTRPVPGNTSATEWGPFYPFEALPQVINPEAGFFQNCNNSAWLVTPSGEIGRDFPPEMVPPGGSRSGRPRRALEILEEPGRRFSVDDMKKLALDVKVVHARETIDHLKAMLPREVRREPEIAAAFELFEGWSGYATRDNRALYLLTVFCWRWSELPEGEGRLERALREAIAYAEKHHGRIDVPWGEVHGVERGGEWFPSGGASNQRGPVGSLTSLHHGEPLRNRPDEGGRFPMEKGSSHVMVAQMTDPPRVWSAKPFGNTADPSSRHYADLTALFAAGELRPVWIERNDILANAESVLGRRVEMALPASLGVVRSTTDRVVELAALSDNGRVTIDEVGGRPFTARIELAAGMRVRVLETDGRLIEDWADHQREVPINRPVVIEFTGR